MVRNADRSRTLQNHFSVLIWLSCAKAPVSQLVEETASKSVQCGFESHRGHRIDEQPWLEISSHGFLFETHLAHVPLCGGSVPCHLLGGAVFFGPYGESAAGVALGVRVGSGGPRTR